MNRRGFTIVELLIVIVVIGILAGITIVAYNGIQDRAKISAAQSAVSQAVKKIEAYKVQNNDTYPSSLAIAAIASSGNTTYNYTSSDGYYCVSATTQGMTYFQTSTNPTVNRGECNGLIAWWPLNGSTNDLGPNALNGTGYNIVGATGQNGKSGGAYAFNGVSSQITVTNNAVLNPVTAITVSAWFQIAGNTGATQGVISKDISSPIANPPYALQINASTNTLQYYQTSTSTTTPTNSVSTPVLTYGNNWYFISGTFEGNTMRVYFNGELSETSTLSDIAPTTGMLRIGQQKTGSGRWFNGTIDDVRIYNRALSASEINQLYLAGAL